MSNDRQRVLEGLFEHALPEVDGVLLADLDDVAADQLLTAETFSVKWDVLAEAVADEDEPWKVAQLAWYLELYGYSDEAELTEHLRGCRVVLDAGCGQGYKAAWFARLAPEVLVVAVDISDSTFGVARRYADVPNLVVVRGDIARTPFRAAVVDLVSCDQVLHHTISPPATLQEFARIARPGARLNTYVYAKKALPRELLDDHFRHHSADLGEDELWALSSQLTELGRRLTELSITVDVPDIPALGIRGGPQDLQRFLYWNFVKCFWNAEFGSEASVATNYDWYAPRTAFRYSQEEFLDMCSSAGWIPTFLHGEPACWSGSFTSARDDASPAGGATAS